jgi:hypothetical protein
MKIYVMIQGENRISRTGIERRVIKSRLSESFLYPVRHQSLVRLAKIILSLRPGIYLG